MRCYHTIILNKDVLKRCLIYIRLKEIQTTLLLINHTHKNDKNEGYYSSQIKCTRNYPEKTHPDSCITLFMLKYS